MNARTPQRNWLQDSGLVNWGREGAQRKMLRLAPAASAADGERGEAGGSHRFELAWNLPKQSGEVQVPLRAVSPERALLVPGTSSWECGGNTHLESQGASSTLRAQEPQ